MISSTVMQLSMLTTHVRPVSKMTRIKGLSLGRMLLVDVPSVLTPRTCCPKRADWGVSPGPVADRGWFAAYLDDRMLSVEEAGVRAETTLPDEGMSRWGLKAVYPLVRLRSCSTYGDEGREDPLTVAEPE
jgi:hypothetical protein